MDNQGESISVDIKQKEAQNFQLQNVIGRSLNREPSQVKLVNPDQFSEEGCRFLYGFTESKGEQPAGFFKMAKTPETKKQLEYENIGIKIASEIGIPTTSILQPYTDTQEGYGIIHVEKLDSENGIFLTSPELIAAADPKLGVTAAHALCASIEKEIPTDIDSTILKRGDWRIDSIETFTKVWNEENDIVFNPNNKFVGSEELMTIVDQTKVTIDPLINDYHNPNIEYFVHNDMALNNVFYGNDKKITFLDFEHASVTHNQFLAQLTDLGNFYGRMWPNPEMQQEFITAFLQESAVDKREYNYQLIRASAVFGSMFLSKYAMKSDHKEHLMSQSLLGNLKENLKKLDEKYKEITQ